MHKAQTTDNKKYSSKIIDCCETMDELADDLYLISCVDMTETEQMSRVSRVLKRKVSAMAIKLDRQSDNLGGLLEAGEA